MRVASAGKSTKRLSVLAPGIPRVRVRVRVRSRGRVRVRVRCRGRVRVSVRRACPP